MRSVLVLLVVLAQCAIARVDHLSVSLDSRKNIFLQTFGFDANGKVNLRLFNFKLDPEPSKHDLGVEGNAMVGVAMIGGVNSNRVRIPQDECLIKGSSVDSQRVLTPDSGLYEDWSKFEVNLKVNDPVSLSLVFSNCLDSKVSFDVG